MRGKQPDLDDIVDEVIRIINESADKSLYGSTWEIIGTLRDRGALGPLDRGTKRHGRSDRIGVRQSKFSLLSAALDRAVKQERVTLVEFDNDIAYTVPLGVPATIESPESDTHDVATDEDQLKLTRISGAMRSNLHYKWGWQELVA